MIYLAFRVSTHHHYGEHPSTKHEELLDAGADVHELVRRVNAHFALPSVVRSERGVQHEIPAFSLQSKPIYKPGGGGTDYTARIEIRESPTLVKTHRARVALWYGRKDEGGKFKPDQQFGEWEPVTAALAAIYGERDNYQVEALPVGVGETKND